MKIAVVSDLHGNLPSFDLNGAEVLFICGDFSPLEKQSDVSEMKEWLENRFMSWCKSLPVEKVIFIAGNHDLVAERCDRWMHEKFPYYAKVTYLCDERTSYISSSDLKIYSIYGTPFCKEFGNWSFMRGCNELARIYRNIPDDIDILLTHDAPKTGSIGCIRGEHGNVDAGNIELYYAIKEKKPRYAFCGHIHTGCHCLSRIGTDTLIANTSILDERYSIAYEPLILEI